MTETSNRDPQGHKRDNDPYHVNSSSRVTPEKICPEKMCDTNKVVLATYLRNRKP
jgi:hypothetical protein